MDEIKSKTCWYSPYFSLEYDYHEECWKLTYFLDNGTEEGFWIDESEMVHFKQFCKRIASEDSNV